MFYNYETLKIDLENYMCLECVCYVLTDLRADRIYGN